MSEKETETSETEIHTDNVIKHSQTEVMAENDMLKASMDKLSKKLDQLKEDYDRAIKQIEADTRSKKITRILQVSDVGMGYLENKSLDELEEIEDLYKHVKTPVFKSTGDNSRFADEHDQILYKLNNMFKFGRKQ